MRIIIAGSLGRFPIGGHASITLQYILGLRSLGHEVYYMEECGEGSWVYHWEEERLTTDLDYPTAYIQTCLAPAGLGERWIYRAGDESRGMTLEEFREVCSSADLLIVRGAPIAQWRPEYSMPKRRIFIDVDPGFTQFSLDNGKTDMVETIARCERLFTIGQRIGEVDCPIPTGGYSWIKTVSPVHLSEWPVIADMAATHFTTIMQWRSYAVATHNGANYGNKDSEFPRFMGLPRSTSQPLLIALTGAPPEQFTEFGWEVVPGWIASRTVESYRNFIRESRAEFCVAKHGYVTTRGGWFSDRSISYLASGRPALVEDTGLSEWLPTGEGVVTFRSPEEAVAGIESINRDYEHHCRMARQIAEEHFSTDRVLPPLLEAAMN
jgi:hypothetical protein